MAMELWAGRYNQCSDNVMDRINLDYVKRNCTFGDVGQLNSAFRDFNLSWRTEIGYTKNFSFKPGTVNIIKDIMTYSLYLQNTQKKAMKTIWNNYTDSRWQMNRLRDDYNRLNDKLIQMRNSGFRIADFEAEVVDIPDKFKESMENWNITLAPMGARVGIMNRTAPASNVEMDRELEFVLTMEIPDIILQVYGRDDDTTKKLGDIPMNGGARIAWSQQLNYMIDNFGNVDQGRVVRNSYYTPLVRGEKLGISEGLYHPFINMRQDHHVCTGDLSDDMRKHFVNFRFIELVMLTHTWLTNFEFGRTYPLNPLAKSFYGMPKSFSEDFAVKVGQNTADCSERIMNEYDYFKEIQEVCDNMECTLRKNCTGYERFSDEDMQREQAERKRRMDNAYEWMDDVLDRYEGLGHFDYHVDEEMYEHLFDTAISSGRNSLEISVLCDLHDTLLREILNAFCRGGLNGRDWVQSGPYNEWGDLWSAVKNHPDCELYTTNNAHFSIERPYDVYQFLGTMLVCNGMDDVQDFLIEALDLYHARNIKLKPTKVSRQWDNGASDDLIRREMEAWATAMGVPQPEVVEGNPIRPEDWVGGSEQPISNDWVTRSNDIVGEDGEPIF